MLTGDFFLSVHNSFWKHIFMHIFPMFLHQFNSLSLSVLRDIRRTVFISKAPNFLQKYECNRIFAKYQVSASFSKYFFYFLTWAIRSKFKYPFFLLQYFNLKFMNASLVKFSFVSIKKTRFVDSQLSAIFVLKDAVKPQIMNIALFKMHAPKVIISIENSQKQPNEFHLKFLYFVYKLQNIWTSLVFFPHIRWIEETEKKRE